MDAEVGVHGALGVYAEKLDDDDLEDEVDGHRNTGAADECLTSPSDPGVEVQRGLAVLLE